MDVIVSPGIPEDVATYVARKQFDFLRGHLGEGKRGTSRLCIRVTMTWRNSSLSRANSLSVTYVSVFGTNQL